MLGNVIWLVLAGWWLALGHLITAVGLALTIIGIPFAWAHLKLAVLSLWPIGRTIVSIENAALLRDRGSEATAQPALGLFSLLRCPVLLLCKVRKSQSSLPQPTARYCGIAAWDGIMTDRTATGLAAGALGRPCCCRAAGRTSRTGPCSTTRAPTAASRTRRSTPAGEPAALARAQNQRF